MLIDLRDETGRELNPLARVLIYAVMLHPREERARNRLLATAKRKRLTDAAQARELCKALTGARIGLAGAILLRLIQIEEAGDKPSLNAASFLVGEMWPKGWLTDPDYSRLRGLGTGKDKKRHLDAWREYRPVAHLWAALLLPLLQDADSPTFLDQGADLIEFIHVADWLAVRGSRIYVSNPRKHNFVPAMEHSKTWRFCLPERNRPEPNWAPNLPPLIESELRALSSRRVAR